MAFDYSRLKGRIVEKYGTNAAFSKEMGWSERTMSLKMNGKVAWKQDEICKAIELLELSVDDVQAYFFTIKVQNLNGRAKRGA